MKHFIKKLLSSQKYRQQCIPEKDTQSALAILQKLYCNKEIGIGEYEIIRPIHWKFNLN